MMFTLWYFTVMRATIMRDLRALHTASWAEQLQAEVDLLWKQTYINPMVLAYLTLDWAGWYETKRVDWEVLVFMTDSKIGSTLLVHVKYFSWSKKILFVLKESIFWTKMVCSYQQCYFLLGMVFCCSEIVFFGQKEDSLGQRK